MIRLEDLAKLADENRADLKIPVNTFEVGGKTISWDKNPATMGVINFSSESWYRESVCLNNDMALKRARILKSQGADFLDIGVESTLEYAQIVTGAEQIKSIEPFLKSCFEEEIPISIESYHTKVIEKSLELGASIINLTGNTFDEDIYKIVSDFDAAVILCFVDGPDVRNVGELSILDNPIPSLVDYFERCLELAQKQGVRKIFIDPGMGFYYSNIKDSRKRIHYQTSIFLESFRLRKLGFPICHALPHAFECFGDEVRSSEAYFAVLATLGGANLLRTHEIPKIKAVLETMNAFSGLKNNMAEGL